MAPRTPRSPNVRRDIEHERLWRKQRLALAFRIFGRFGFDEGVAGHITARDPGNPERFWVNPFGMSFKQITVDDLILVDHQGQVVEGSWPVNRAAFAIHASIHQARPDVIVLDVVMPDMEGNEILIALRRAGTMPKIILITGYGEAFLRSPSLLAGSALVGALLKPFREAELGVLLRRALGRA